MRNIYTHNTVNSITNVLDSDLMLYLCLCLLFREEGVLLQVLSHCQVHEDVRIDIEHEVDDDNG